MTSPFLISCCSIALRDQTIFASARKIAHAGFAGIEIWHPHIEKMSQAELGRVGETCASLGLNVTVIAPYFSFTQGRKKSKQSLKSAELVLQAAEILGVKKIRTFIDCGPDGIPSESADANHWISARDGLRKLCAMDPTIQFVVETHENTLADTLPSVRRILEEVALPNLRLNYQATRDFIGRGFLACLEELYPAVSHLHWQQIRLDQSPTYIEEEGVIDFASLIDFLETKEYRGTAAVEYCWMPVQEERIRSARKYLDRLTRTRKLSS
jgi:3-dehydroshikimate dehydratase